jgi:SAM-dependent methyltransferase
MPDDPTFIDDNRLRWDERVAIHAASAFYDVAGFVAGAPSPHVFPWMLEEIGPLDGLHVLHLQCHFGMDTLELARRGAATVTGLDFSGEAVARATALAEEVGLADRARFVEADVRRWADVVAACTRPGGRLHLTEVHPVARVFEDDGSIRWPYLETGEPETFDISGTYTDATVATVHDRGHEWSHGLGEVVTALVGAGMRLDLLHEHTRTFYRSLPFLEEVAPGEWAVPPPGELPLLFSLLATRTT